MQRRINEVTEEIGPEGDVLFCYENGERSPFSMPSEVAAPSGVNYHDTRKWTREMLADELDRVWKTVDRIQALIDKEKWRTLYYKRQWKKMQGIADKLEQQVITLYKTKAKITDEKTTD